MQYLEHFHHQITGNPQGHKLVFLHGLMGSAANWRRIAAAFEDDFHILTFDQRGHGRSFQPPSGYHPRDYADDLVKILDELKWLKIALVGHSMGGRNAMEFAARFSQRVNALVIEDIGPDSSSTAISNIERLLGLVPTPFATREEARHFFENQYPNLIPFYSQPVVIAKFFLSNIEQKADGTHDWRFSKDGVLQSMREGRKEDHWDSFCNLKVPILIVRGANSNDLSPEVYQKMLARMPQAQGAEIADSGHWVHFDQPDAFVSALKEFFHSTLGTTL